MPEPIRILHVFGKTALGGAESRTMDLYRHMDRSRVQFDFLTHSEKPDHFDEEIKTLGGQVYHLPRFRFINYFSYRKAAKVFFKEHREFACVQGHMTSTASIYLPEAKAAGIPVTVAHARSAGVDKGLKGYLTRLLRKNLDKKADFLFTCSHLAGISVFGEKAVRENRTIYVPNAIPVEKFAYHPEIRESVRKKLNIQDKYVIGHVGRFHYAKNHEYLFSVFARLCSHPDMKDRNPVLVLLGDGDRKAEFQELARQMKIENRVFFLGNRTPAADYYQAMDYLIYPSRFEGLPGAVVEAQAAGLRCLISDTIAKEVMITGLVHAMSIKREPGEWADYAASSSSYKRDNRYYDIVVRKFDVKEQARKLMEFYETGEAERLG